MFRVKLTKFWRQSKSISALLRKRPKCCVAAKRRFVPKRSLADLITLGSSRLMWVTVSSPLPLKWIMLSYEYGPRDGVFPW